MKNIFKSAFLCLVGALFLTSCEEDTVTFNGNSFVSLSDVAFTTRSVTEGAGTVTFPVTLSKTYKEDVVVTFQVTGNNVTEGTDYTILTPTVTIPAGEYTADFSIALVDDDILNTVIRTLDITMASTNVAGLDLGIENEGSYHKVLTIVNDDCPSKFTYWLGNLTLVDSSEGNFAGTGESNEDGDCDILVVTGNLGGESDDYINNDVFNITFTPENESGTEGSVEVPVTIVGQRTSGDVTYTTKYAGSGTYSTVTGLIVIDYEFQAYTAAGVLAGNFWTGTTTIKLAN